MWKMKAIVLLWSWIKCTHRERMDVANSISQLICWSSCGLFISCRLIAAIGIAAVAVVGHMLIHNYNWNYLDWRYLPRQDNIEHTVHCNFQASIVVQLMVGLVHHQCSMVDYLVLAIVRNIYLVNIHLFMNLEKKIYGILPLIWFDFQ